MDTNYNTITNTTNNKKIMIGIVIFVVLLFVLGIVFMLNKRQLTSGRAGTTLPNGNQFELSCPLGDSFVTCSWKKEPNVDYEASILVGGTTLCSDTTKNKVIIKEENGFYHLTCQSQGEGNYKCEVVAIDPEDQACKITDKKEVVCQSSPSPTPNCTDCIDGDFICKLKMAELGSMDECSNLSFHDVLYTPIKPELCPSMTPPPQELDCSKHDVYLVDENGNKKEVDCEQVKKDPGYEVRLHNANEEVCMNYEIKVYKKGTNEIDSDFKVCEDCDLKSGCPILCKEPQELTKDQLKDIPNLPKNGNECIPNVCELRVDIDNNSCSIPSTMTFSMINSYPNGTNDLYLDDEFGNPALGWIYDAGSRFEHTYINGGHYDVVLACNQGTITYLCAKRITLACDSGGGGGTGTPSPTPYCIEIKPKLEFGCRDCPTPTKQKCANIGESCEYTPCCGGECMDVGFDKQCVIKD